MAIILVMSLSVSGCPTATGDRKVSKSSSFPTVYLCTAVYD